MVRAMAIARANTRAWARASARVMASVRARMLMARGYPQEIDRLRL